MTQSARITQTDFERAAKAAASASRQLGQAVRVIFRLEEREIEIIIGDSAVGKCELVHVYNEWDDE